jgi:hypothetical protein
MEAGNFRYQDAGARVGGWRGSDGTYYINEGHHRIAAAIEIFTATGNRSPLNSLLQNGLFFDGIPPGVGPLPIRFDLRPITPLFDPGILKNEKKK